MELSKKAEEIANKEVTITTTYGELARAYAVLGKVNGYDLGDCLWLTVEASIRQVSAGCSEAYTESIWPKSDIEVIPYRRYQQEWLEALFGEQVSEKQKQIKELEAKAEELLEKVRELKGDK